MDKKDKKNKNPFSDELYQQRTKPLPPDIRGEYFRDQTKIIHSQPFRRLKSKTQVFSDPENDHICTRIEHVLHVATIATAVCKGLNKTGKWQLNEELAYAIGLAHDLGHAPFGHEGERALSKKIYPKHFMHEVNGYRVVQHLANYGQGLNLTYAVKDGMLCHCGEDFNNNALKPGPVPNDLESIKDRGCLPSTYEGCIVRLADKIAYLGRDIEDALREGIITSDMVPDVVYRYLGKDNGEMINTLVTDLTENSKDKDAIGFSKEKFDLILVAKEFNYKYIYGHPSLVRIKKILGESVGGLFDYYKALFLEHGFGEGYSAESSAAGRSFGHYIAVMKDFYGGPAAAGAEMADIIVTDYISGMTDSYALFSIREALGVKLDFN